MIENKLFFERYRPKTMEEVIIPERIKNELIGYISKNDIPNLLLYGTGGIGKTSAAKVIINSLGMDFIEINGSIDTSIEVVRDKIIKFASTNSLINAAQMKCVFVTEADGFSEQAKNSMKNIIEKFAGNIRFIFDTNYVDKLSQPIRSRCVEIDFNPKKDEYPDLMRQLLARCCMILEENNIIYQKKDVANLIKTRFPDMRKIMNDLQKGSVTGELILANDSPEELFEALIAAMNTRKYDEVREVVKNITDPESVYIRMYNRIDDIIERGSLPQAILIIGEWQHRTKSCVSPEITLLACLTDMLSKEIKFKI
jgi:replication factor C small subunit